MIVEGSDHGELRGTQLQPRQLIDLTYTAGWAETKNLHTAVSVWFAESDGFDHAFNDNLDDTGNVVSRDCGIAQVNIPAAEIGTDAETRLYDPATCLAAARKLWLDRKFEPWVAFNTGVYKHPVYSTRAALGLMNWALGEMGGVTVPVFTLADLRAKKLW